LKASAKKREERFPAPLAVVVALEEFLHMPVEHRSACPPGSVPIIGRQESAVKVQEKP